MRRIILGTIALTFFSLSILFFQISCRKNTNAQSPNYVLPPATSTTLGGVIVGNGLTVTSNGTIAVNPNLNGITQLNKIVYARYDYKANKPDGIWIANYDGSNQTKINLAIPGYDSYSLVSPKLSPDGKTIFFIVQATLAGKGQWHIYSANVDGSNVKKIIDGGNGDYEFDEIGGAY